MPTPLFGRRTAIECAFLVVVPFAAWKAGASIVWIIAPAALAYLLVLAVEVVLWRRGERPAVPAAAAAAAPAAERVAPRRRRSTSACSARSRNRSRSPSWRSRSQSRPEPAPEPEPGDRSPCPCRSRRGSQAVPEPEPEPEPVRAPEPVAAVAQVVADIGATQAPRQWNDLGSRAARPRATSDDPIADEERTFLLLYLRDFAGADGLLPVDFDDLVRQSFGALVANR